MLSNGQFIKEPPPRIGEFYVRPVKGHYVTPEEGLMQNVLLARVPMYRWLNAVGKVFKL